MLLVGVYVLFALGFFLVALPGADPDRPNGANPPLDRLGVLAISVLHVLGDVLLVLFAACSPAVSMQSASRLRRPTHRDRTAGRAMEVIGSGVAVAGLFAWLGAGTSSSKLRNSRAICSKQRLASLRHGCRGRHGQCRIGRAEQRPLRRAHGGHGGRDRDVHIGRGRHARPAARLRDYIALSPQRYVEGAIRLLPLSGRRRAQQV